jgi:phosphatidylglycerophosphate synthase
MLEPFRRGQARVIAPVIGLLARLRVPPNAVSLSQIPFGFAVASLIALAPRVALGLFVLTLLLDGVDGALARSTGRTSPFGGLVDQISDHIREITVIGGLVAAGALRGEIGVAYALTYPLFNFLLYVANRHGAQVPVALKTWMVFYPFLFLFLWFEINWLDYAGGAAAGSMVLVGVQVLIGLRGRIGS